ncbi:MAG: 50S ribosomal protein L21, partial [Bradyrhizobium sp.]
RKRGYRDEITVLRITEILTNDNKPSIGPRPKREKPVVSAPTDGDDEAPKVTKKKAPAKKTAKAPAKPRAKPAARKAPAKKAAAKGSRDKK